MLSLVPRAARYPAFAALQHPDFARYWFAVILSLSGLWMRVMVVGWLVNDLTHSPRLLGAVSFATAFPVLVVSPVAGLVADRFDRRLVLLATQALHGVVVGAIALLTALGVVQVWHLLVASTVSGVISSFDWPARLSLVPRLVPAELMPNAVALNSAAFNAAGLLGPTVGGILLPLIGAAWCLAIGALVFVPISLVLLTLRPLHEQDRGSGEPWLTNLANGYHYVMRDRTLSSLLLLELVPLIFGLTYSVLMPVRAETFANGLGLPSARVLGWLMGAAAFGSLTGVLSVAGGFGARARGRTMMLTALAFGLLVVVFAQSRWLPLALLFVVGIGLADAAYATLNGTLVQTTVDDAYRGRVMGLYSLLWGLTPIGSLEAGELATRFGVPTTLTINGAIVVTFVTILGVTRRHLWHLK